MTIQQVFLNSHLAVAIQTNEQFNWRGRLGGIFIQVLWSLCFIVQTSPLAERVSSQYVVYSLKVSRLKIFADFIRQSTAVENLSY